MNVPDVFNFRPSGKLSREGTSTTMQRRPLPSVAIHGGVHHRYRDSSTFYKSSIQTYHLRKKFKEEEDAPNFYFSLPKPASPPLPPNISKFFSPRTLLLLTGREDTRIGNGRKLRFFRGEGGEGEEILRGDR